MKEFNRSNDNYNKSKNPKLINSKKITNSQFNTINKLDKFIKHNKSEYPILLANIIPNPKSNIYPEMYNNKMFNNNNKTNDNNEIIIDKNKNDKNKIEKNFIE